jgi:uncharacterized membrane protein
MKKLTSITLFTALIGALDSTYLTWIKLTHNEAQCVGGLGDCFTVNTSKYSEIYGIPIAVIGLLAYLAIIAILILEPRIEFFKDNGPLMVFGLSLIGVIYSAFLTYLEAAVIHAWCPYCVLSAIAITVIFIVSLIRLNRSQAA